MIGIGTKIEVLHGNFYGCTGYVTMMKLVSQHNACLYMISFEINANLFISLRKIGIPADDNLLEYQEWVNEVDLAPTKGKKTVEDLNQEVFLLKIRCRVKTKVILFDGTNIIHGVGYPRKFEVKDKKVWFRIRYLPGKPQFDRMVVFPLPEFFECMEPVDRHDAEYLTIFKEEVEKMFCVGIESL